MSPESSSIATKLCPTCGTRLSEDATRCLVCGADLGTAARPAQPAKAVQGSRMPEITLSLPAAIGLLALFLIIGFAFTFLALRNKAEAEAPVVADVSPSATITETGAPTETPTLEPPTETPTPLPTPTPLSYTVVSGDSCLAIAAHFDVSVESIRALNNLGVDCILSTGKTLQIPQPTPTATALPTATLGPADQTEAACKKAEHTVTDTDTLSSIAQAYQVTMQSIKDANGLTSDTVYVGTTLTIPLCKTNNPNAPTPTATAPAPYAAPNLLLPADGAPFGIADETVTLQWASAGTLRDNEAYAVTIEDVTEGQGRKLVDYVTDTKYIVPANFRPNDATPHVLRWWVMVARKTGTTTEGNPIWEPAGNQSTPRDFTWSGSGAQPTATTQSPN